jgi:hypothetical protein
MKKQLLFVLLAVIGVMYSYRIYAQVKIISHEIVYYQDGRFAGWPANNGAFIFDNGDILTGFIEGAYVLEDGHNISDTYKNMLAKSNDGGTTWIVYDPVNYVGDFKNDYESKTLNAPINFKHPRFVMRVVGTGYHGATDSKGHFFYSYDAGESWSGPFRIHGLAELAQLGEHGLDEITSRTDYIVEGKHECLLFMSARKKGEFGTDRLFTVKTMDGGQNFEFISWVIPPFDKDKEDNQKVELYENSSRNPFASECRAVMSNSVRLNNGDYFSVVRRKFMVKGGTDRHWIDAYISKDEGRHWEFQSKIADTGRSNGNPAAIVQLNNNQLWVVYGERNNGTICTKFSNDLGLSWSDSFVIMDGFWSVDMEYNDLGYPRLLKKSDGSLVAIYYYSTKEHPHHLRASSWNPNIK